MKKIITLIMLALLPMLASAYDAEVDGIYYYLMGNEAVVTRGSKEYTGAVIIPRLVTYRGKVYTVTTIGMAFQNCRSLTSVTIPNSVTSINYRSFQGCSGLTSITIPNSVTTIGEDVFSGCSGLNSITIGSGVTSIAKGAFRNCSSLTSITIPNNVTNIEDETFSGCIGLTSIIIPNRVTNIGNNAFYGCSGLTSVTIGTGVTCIGDRAFYGCRNLTFITIPNSVISIGECTFEKCTGLTSIIIGSGLTSIGRAAFYDCYGLQKVIVQDIVAWCGISFDDNPLSFAHLYSDENTEITDLVIPNSVTSISNSAFENCSSLTSVTIGNSVTSIGWGAFAGCRSLTSLTIGSSVTSIGWGAFTGCDGLQKVIVPNIGAWCGFTFASVTENPLYYAGHIYSDENTEITDLVIPNGVNSINDMAFYNCNSLTSVTIPSSVTSIGNLTFSRCGTLTSIAIGSGVKSIGEGAFSRCSSLKKVIVPNIATWCDITFGSDSANPLYYARHIYSDENTEITDLVIPNSVTSINDMVFYNCGSLTSVIIPNSVTSIGNYSFRNCSSLTSVNLTNHVNCIGDYAFGGCWSLTSITIGNNLISVSSDAIPASTTIYTSIGQSLFTLWNAGYTNIKETGSENGLGVPELSVDCKSASSMTISVTNAHSGFINTLGVSDNKQTLEEENQTISLKGLEPDTQYEVSLTLAFESYSYEIKSSVRTEVLTLTTLQPRVISDGNVIVAAQSNLDDEEVNVGFEWRRIDWTDDFDSKTGGAYLYEGAMEGYIRSLNSRYLWKFRPYYTSNAGNTYYGEWKGLDPSDYSYFEPMVHTYSNINVQGNTAEVRGYAMRGTDNIATQGFIYWQNRSSYSLRKKAASIPSDAITVTTAKTNIMTATLEGLEYETEYCCVAFVTTSEDETFYGEVQTFSTSFDPDGIREIKNESLTPTLSKGEGEWFSLDGRKLGSKPTKSGLYINGGKKVLLK